MEETLKEFKELLGVCNLLMGPNGCPWDIEQTLESLRATVLEEAYEVIEAIDLKDDLNLQEELGDLLYNVIFLCKIAEKEGKFSLKEVIFMIKEKLISRHPHIFAGTTLKTAQEVLDQWEHIKKKEKSHRQSALDGLPKNLPSLLKGHKMAGKIEKASFFENSSKNSDAPFKDEEEFGELLWSLIKQGRRQGINAEMALQATLLKKERAFREWETYQKNS